ncbi:uncharacterized protein LOC126323717 [Schistocerca gregaria]|uniref:uncharacterized protein LOC126323717 n=1 Tax=Schistocerca gregaria TaxID=7010 RepID=UPI00211DED81|nr:uncharacterized protein LOC126323717 [Schistocerca gregaria]
MLATLWCILFPEAFRRDDGPMFWKLCFINPMGSTLVVVGLALVGLVVNAADVVHRLQHIATPSEASRDRPTCSVSIKWRPSPVSVETERQIQLMSSLLNFENNFMLLAGILLDSTALIVPWLAVQTVTVLLELLIFCSQIATVGLHMGRFDVLTTATTVHNFLQVLCFLCKKRVIC